MREYTVFVPFLCMSVLLGSISSPYNYYNVTLSARIYDSDRTRQSTPKTCTLP